MRQLVVSNDTPDPDGSESMAVGLSDPLGWDGATGAASTVVYYAPLPDGLVRRLLSAACSPVVDELVGRVAGPALGAGRLCAGSVESHELASSLALRLPTSC